MEGAGARQGSLGAKTAGPGNGERAQLGEGWAQLPTPSIMTLHMGLQNQERGSQATLEQYFDPNPRASPPHLPSDLLT